MKKYIINYIPNITNNFVDKKIKLKNDSFLNDYFINQKIDVIFNEKTKSFEKIIKIEGKLKLSENNDNAFYIDYNFSTDMLVYNCKYCKENKKKICHHIAYLIDEYNLSNIKNCLLTDEELDRKYLNLIEEKNQEYILKQRKKVSETVEAFKKIIQKTDVLPLKEKVTLKPVIEISKNGVVDITASLSLKIGTSKFYQIKNILDLLDRVRYNMEHSYSKNFTLIHNIENFDEKSRRLIKELEDIFNATARSEYIKYKSLDISSYLLEKIIDIYKNSFIEVSTEEDLYEAYISNDEIKIPLKIANNKLKPHNIDNLIILPGHYNDYLLDNKVIKKIIADNDERQLIRFINNNPSFSFKYAEDDFARSIYSRYSEYLNAEKEFKEKYNLTDVNIKVFFDIDNDVLKYHSEFYVANNEGEQNVSEEEIRKNYHNQKINKYDNFLENLGFIDNKISSTNDIGRFLVTDFEKFKNIATIYLSENIKKMQVKKISKTVTSLGYDTGMLSICFEGLNYSNEELLKILAGIKKKVKYVKLNKDTIVDVETIEAQRLLDTVEEFKLDTKHLAEKQTVPLYQSLKLLSDNKDYKNFKTDDMLKNILHDIANYKTSCFEVPCVLKEHMRDYQVEAFKWMKTLIKYNFCGILADDMGLGKTLEIISLIESDDVMMPSLIVCPKSLSYNWKNEFNKWVKKVNVSIIKGTSADRRNIINSIESNEKSIYITSYDSLKNDLDSYKDLNFRFMILDEAQFIKNHTTLKAQSVKQINSQLRFVLTGTPIENTVVDLWSIFDFLMPNYLYNYSMFKNQYEKEITVNSNADVIKGLVKKITPFILRRTKDEVLKDLPEKIETIQYAEMSSKQRKIYEAQILKTRDIIKNKTNKIELLSQLTRLRQICVDPKLFIDDFDEDSAKIELAMNLIVDYVLEGHKILVFSQFTSVFPIIESKLKERNIKFFEITGKTDAFNRVQMAQMFNDEEGEEKVFLVSLKAGGTGLNLVGADIVIHLDPWWNISAENQATDRAHRIGQKNVVKVIRLVCENSIEQKVLDLQEAKKQVINSVIANNDDNIIKLTDDDLYYLLS